MRTIKFNAPKQYQDFFGSKAQLPVDEFEKLEVKVNSGRSSLEATPENLELLDKLNIPFMLS